MVRGGALGVAGHGRENAPDRWGYLALEEVFALRRLGSGGSRRLDRGKKGSLEIGEDRHTYGARRKAAPVPAYAVTSSTPGGSETHRLVISRQMTGKKRPPRRSTEGEAVGRGWAYCFEVAAFSMIAATAAGLDS